MNDNPVTDREQITRRALGALEVAGERLVGLGCSDREVGNAMIAAGLSRLSRTMSAGALVEHLAHLTGGIAEASGIDLAAAAEKPATPTH